jgi:hypothetical protein
MGQCGVLLFRTVGGARAVSSVGAIVVLAAGCVAAPVRSEERALPDRSTVIKSEEQPVRDSGPPVGTAPIARLDPVECHPDPELTSMSGGPLVLRGSKTAILGRGPYRFAYICVKDEASIRVCDQTTIEIDGQAETVIAGAGIGNLYDRPIKISLSVAGDRAFYVLFDNRRASIAAHVAAPKASLATFALTGKTGLEITGGPLHKVQHNAGWGDTRNFPPCH